MTRVAVIGLGIMGKHHARNYARMDDVELVAVCDLNHELAMNVAERYNCKAYAGYQELLNREKLDAVSIAVPTTTHKDVVLEAVRKGLHILVEKPIAGTLCDAEKIIEETKNRGVLLQVGHVERFNPAVIKLKQIIQKGILGNVSSIIARRVGTVPERVRDTSVVLDLAVHDIDIINYLYESEPDKVLGSWGQALIGKRHDYADIFLTYGERSGFIQVNWITPIKIRNLSVTGSNGYAELDYINQELIVYESNYTREETDDLGDFNVKFGTPKVTQVRIEREEPIYLELLHFIESVRNGKPVLVNGEIGYAALKIALEATGQLGE